MLILGDAVEAILRSLETSGNNNNNGEGGEAKATTLSASATSDQKALLTRPWVDHLVVNKSHWQKKQDDGESLITLLLLCFALFGLRIFSYHT